MLFLKMSFRNLLRQKRRSTLNILTLAVGFSLLSLSIGVAKGSYGAVIKMFTENHTGHIQMHRKDFLENPSLYKTLEEDHPFVSSRFPFIRSWTPRIYSSALAFKDKKSLGVQIIGIDPEKEFQTSRLEERISSGRFSKEGLVISFSLSQTLKAKAGETIALISQAADGSIANEIFPISGILKEEDNARFTCLLGLKKAQDFLSLHGKIHEIAIIADSYENAPKYSEEISRRFHDPHLDVQPWQVVEKDFYEAMQADIKGMWISLSIVILIVGIGVLNSVLMNLLERKREYAILKALGSSPFYLFRLIIAETQMLSLIAIFIGFAFAFSFNYYLSRYGIALPTPVKFAGVVFTKYRSVNSLEVYLIPSVLISTTSFLVSVFPAMNSIRKSPAEELRYV